MNNIENDLAFYRALVDAHTDELNRLKTNIDILRPAIYELHMYFIRHDIYKKSKKIEETMETISKTICL